MRYIGIVAIAVLFFLPVILFTFVKAHADDIPPHGLAGSPFSDPSLIQKMPEGWAEEPVKHDTSIGEADLAVTLDQHLYPALLSIIKEYAEKNNIKIIVNEGTCGISAGMLSRKEADIGGFCCPPAETDRLPGLKFHTFGISPLALLVHPDNPIDNVALEQARSIFKGDIYRWSELKTSTGKAGPNLPIQPVGRLHCKLRPGHWKLLLDDIDLFSPGLQEVGAIPDMIFKVASNKRAIGYAVLWNQIRYEDRGMVKALKINGYDPYNKSHLASLRYPLYRVYNLTTWEGENVKNPKAERLVDHIMKNTDKISEEHKIIPASSLRRAGWKFNGSELVGEPE